MTKTKAKREPTYLLDCVLPPTDVTADGFLAKHSGREKASSGRAQSSRLVAGSGRDSGYWRRVTAQVAAKWAARLYWSRSLQRAPALAAAPNLSTILKPIELDPLTVADDDKFLDQIEQQPNVPAPIKNGLRALY
jgi:hypothetical protein